MKYTALILLFCIQANATYVSKFWLTPKTQQLQITNTETKSMLLLNMEYDALKMFLYSYELTHAGNYDPVLSEVSVPEKFHKLIPLIESVEHISMSHKRFGDLDEDFVSYSVFGMEPEKGLVFSTEKEMDIYLIKRMLSKLFKDEYHYGRAKNTSSCLEYL